MCVADSWVAIDDATRLLAEGEPSENSPASASQTSSNESDSSPGG
jgi:hypothetical protein